MKLVIAISLVFSIQFIYSQDSVTFSLKNRNLIKEGFLDSKDVILAPIKWNKKEWITTGSLLTAASILYSFDDEIKNFVQDNRNNFTNDLSTNFFDPLGDGRYIVGSTAGLFLYGLVFKKERVQNLGITTGKALAISTACTYITKRLFHRHRPSEEPHSPYVWDGPSLSNDFDSFYSGHTVTAFTFATVIASEYKKTKIVPIAMYSIASLTALSRLNDDKHWATDIVIGAAMGYGIGKLVYNNDKKRAKIYPELSAQYMGMKLVFK